MWEENEKKYGTILNCAGDTDKSTVFCAYIDWITEEKLLLSFLHWGWAQIFYNCEVKQPLVK